MKWDKLERGRSSERGIPNLREGLAKVMKDDVVEGRRAAYVYVGDVCVCVVVCMMLIGVNWWCWCVGVF